MEIKDVIREVKLRLTGNVLETEIDDKTFKDIVKSALLEISRFYNATEFMEVPMEGKSCVDLTKHPEIKFVTQVYRQQGETLTDNAEATMKDPVALSQLQMYNFGSGYFSNDWIYRIGAYNTVKQISNTLSTDLAFRQVGNELYINMPNGKLNTVTLEYVPYLKAVSQIKSEYWQTVLISMALALTKIQLGRIRTRFTQTSGIWNNDGDKILEEGNAEYKELKDKLAESRDYIQFVD